MTAEQVLAFVDIDGVVADVRHRLQHVESQPKDWDRAGGRRRQLRELGQTLAR